MGTKNYKTGVMMGRRWRLWRIILDWDTLGTQGRRCFKLEVYAPNIIKLVLCWGGVGGCGELVWTGIIGDAGKEVF